MASLPEILRTWLFDNPEGKFVHDVVLDSCRRHADKVAIIDASCSPTRRVTYAEYGEMLEQVARGLVAARICPGDRIGIFLPNCWEFGVAYHAATLAGAVPTTLNPTYRQREVCYQLENSGAVALISDGALLKDIDLSGLTSLRNVYTTRTAAPAGSGTFDALLRYTQASLPEPESDSRLTLATLPYSSGTTGLPKGVMLSHYNLVANVYQTLGPNATTLVPDDVMLCFLPLYHIYGLTVALTLSLSLGSRLILMPRFDVQKLCALLVREGVTMIPVVPPAINAMCQAVEAGIFPKEHSV